MNHRKRDAARGAGFDIRVPDELIDLLANPPAAWTPTVPAEPAPTADQLKAARAKRLRRLAKSAWTSTSPYRVHYYDPAQRGTWLRYFEQRSEAEAFSVGKTLWGEPAIVEVKRGKRS